MIVNYFQIKKKERRYACPSLELCTYLTIIHRMSKYCLLISLTRFDNILWTFCSWRNNEIWNKRSMKPCYNMSLSTVSKAPRWSSVTTNKINGPSGRMLSYIINLLLFCHCMPWIIKTLPWRPERNMWFRRGSQSIKIRWSGSHFKENSASFLKLSFLSSWNHSVLFNTKSIWRVSQLHSFLGTCLAQMLQRGTDRSVFCNSINTHRPIASKLFRKITLPACGYGLAYTCTYCIYT